MMGHASQLLDLHKSCLARFEAVILSQRLVGGRKTLSLFIEVPVYNEKRRRRRRTPNANRRAKDRKRKEEKKRSKEGSPPSPSPTEQPAPAQPDSPMGWFDTTIPQLDGCGSAAKGSRSPASSRSSATSSSRPVEGSHSPVASSSSPIVCSRSRSPAVSSPAASIPRPAAIGSSGPAVRGGRNPAVRGGRSPAASSPCPVMSRDDEGVGVHSSDDGTSDEEYNDKVQELLTAEEMEVIDKFLSAEAEARAEAYKLKFV